MKNLMTFTLLSLSGCFFSVLSHAAGPYLFEGTDISPMVTQLQQQIVTLKTPITVYHWSMDGGIDDPEGHGIAQDWSHTYWNLYGTPNQDMYGRGFYGAADPVFTFIYGGGLQANWLLIEATLPVGATLVDVGYNMAILKTPSEEYKKLATQFNCPTDGIANSLLVSGGVSLNEDCKRLTKHIYQDIFKIDALAYMYGQTQFSECKDNGMGSRAFVITDSKWMKPGLIHYYTARTNDNLEGRVRIQTLFLKSLTDANKEASNASNLQPIADYLNKHPSSELKGSTTRCEGSSCVITVNFCDPENHCDSVALPPLPRAGGPLISAQIYASHPGAYPSALLWPDLEGKPKSTTISTWLKGNKIACSGSLPYTPAPAP
jgi:hypothetical protein